MKIAIIIVNNLTDVQNQEQISTLRSLVEDYREIQYDENGDPIVDENGDPILFFRYYQITNLNIPHEIYFYQIIPYGVTPPANLNILDSRKVFYGEGDADKNGEHPRFFNWGLKRGTDYGADIVIYLRDYSKITLSRIRNGVNKLQENVVFGEELYGNSGTLKLLKEVGQLDESKNFNLAVNDYKSRITQKGLLYG